MDFNKLQALVTDLIQAAYKHLSMLYYEALPSDTTLKQKLTQIIKQKRRRSLQLRLLHENAKLQISKMTVKLIFQLG